MKKLLFTLGLLAATTALSAQSNLFVDTTITPEQMVMDFFNTSQVTVTNVTFTGAAGAVAFFEAANTDLDLLAGLMLSSGRCVEAANPADYFASSATGADGDADLNVLLQTGVPTFDAAVLEFDLVSQVDTLCFIYRFGSEEYPEYVCSQFNDLFAFFVNGPGYAPNTNIALIPGDTLPVAINNVNGGNPFNATCPPSHEEFYVAYDTLMGQHAAYDGLTTTLPAKFIVQTGESYHVKIALADVSDFIFDSGVFLSINSLGGDSLLVPVAELAAPVVNGNTVTFTNESRYGTAWFWDFGDGTNSTERNPAPHTFPQFAADETESGGTFEVTLITTNYCCSDTTKTLVSLGSSSVDNLNAAAFRLSPNPASDWLMVEPAGAQDGSVRIFDAAGRIVREQALIGFTKIDLQALNAGVYTCQVIQGKTSAQQRFVKK